MTPSRASRQRAGLEHVEVDGMTREAFILRGALAAGALYGIGAVGPFVGDSLAQRQDREIEVLRFLLTLEQLQAAYYKQGNDEVADLGARARVIVEGIEREEQDHVEAIERAIRGFGGKPGDAPTFDFGEAFADQRSYLRLAQTFENAAVGAYSGAVPRVGIGELRSALAAIGQVEARHAAGLSALRGRPKEVAAGAFDRPRSEQRVRKEFKPYVQPKPGKPDSARTTPDGTTPKATTPQRTTPQTVPQR